MDQPDVAVIQAREHVLRPPVHPNHRPPFEAASEIRRQRDAQILPALLDPHQAPAFENGGKTPANGFDFWKFRHGGVR